MDRARRHGALGDDLACDGELDGVKEITGPKPTLMGALLRGAIDYAGLFPPAGLGLADAVRNYETYRTGPNKWMLGRFIIPVAQLEELVPFLPWETKEAWKISVIAKPSDAPVLNAFNERHGNRARIDSVETPVANAREVIGLSALWATFMVFAEVNPATDPTPVIAELGKNGVRAKIRTGGVVASAIPPAAQVSRFMVACRKFNVAYKATAGLHHAIGAEYPLTYEPGCARAKMFGFLNVILASTLASMGSSASDVSTILQAGDELVTPRGLTLPGGRKVSIIDIAKARGSALLSFGSCSFEEPVAELQQRGLL
jgi:hypothetical protein